MAVCMLKQGGKHDRCQRLCCCGMTIPVGSKRLVQPFPVLGKMLILDMGKGFTAVCGDVRAPLRQCLPARRSIGQPEEFLDQLAAWDPHQRDSLFRNVPDAVQVDRVSPPVGGKDAIGEVLPALEHR